MTTQQRNVLIADNLRLVYHAANRLVLDRPEVRRLGREEAISVGFLTLTKAADGFDPTRGAKFSYYAYVSIRREILRAARDNNVIRVPPGVGQPGGNWGRDASHLLPLAEKARAVRLLGGWRDSDGDPQLATLASRGRDPLEEVADADELEAAIRRAGLTEREAAAVRALARGEPQWATGRHLGVSRACVGQHLKRALRKLRAGAA